MASGWLAFSQATHGCVHHIKSLVIFRGHVGNSTASERRPEDGGCAAFARQLYPKSSAPHSGLSYAPKGDPALTRDAGLGSIEDGGSVEGNFHARWRRWRPSLVTFIVPIWSGTSSNTTFRGYIALLTPPVLCGGAFRIMLSECMKPPSGRMHQANGACCAS